MNKVCNLRSIFAHSLLCNRIDVNLDESLFYYTYYFSFFAIHTLLFIGPYLFIGSEIKSGPCLCVFSPRRIHRFYCFRIFICFRICQSGCVLAAAGRKWIYDIYQFCFIRLWVLSPIANTNTTHLNTNASMCDRDMRYSWQTQTLYRVPFHCFSGLTRERSPHDWFHYKHFYILSKASI